MKYVTLKHEGSGANPYLDGIEEFQSIFLNTYRIQYASYCHQIKAR